MENYDSSTNVNDRILYTLNGKYKMNDIPRNMKQEVWSRQMDQVDYQIDYQMKYQVNNKASNYIFYQMFHKLYSHKSARIFNLIYTMTSNKI